MTVKKMFHCFKKHLNAFMITYEGNLDTKKKYKHKETSVMRCAVYTSA